MPRRSAPTRYSRRSTPSSDLLLRARRAPGRPGAAPSFRPANENNNRLVSPHPHLADGGHRRHPHCSGDPADHFPLYPADSLVHLDRGAQPLPVHLDGDARRDDRHPRAHAFRGGRLARAEAEGECAVAHRFAAFRSRVRAGFHLVGHPVRPFRLESALRARRAADAVDLHRLAPRRIHLDPVPRRVVHRRRPRLALMSSVALPPGMAALVLFGVFFVLLVARVPVAFALGLACFPILLIEPRLSPMTLFNETFKAYNAFILLAVPFFLLTANLMNVGGITDRLVRLSRTMVGNFPGALAQINVLLSVFFAGISGSSTADAASQSKIFIEAQVKEGYGLSFSIAITAVSAVLAVIIPPSILMIVWGGVISTSIGALYLAGIIPGLLIALAQMVTVHVYSKIYRYPVYPRSTLREFFVAAWQSLPALFTPFIIVGGILLGWFTPTESAAIAVIYAALLSIFIYREMDLRHLYHACAETGRLASVALFCVGTASAFGWLLAYYQIPKALLENVTSWGLGPIGVGFFIAFAFLVVGCFLDAIPAIIIVGTTLQPLAASVHMHPVHFAIIGIVALAFGLVTPPYGLCLMISCAVAKVPLKFALKDTMIMLVPMLLMLAAIIIWPEIPLILPRLVAPELLK